MRHEIKIWPEFFGPVVAGVKPWELRTNDRNYQTGDELQMREWDNYIGTFTGRWVLVEVTYLYRVERTNMVILSTKVIEHYTPGNTQDNPGSQQTS